MSSFPLLLELRFQTLHQLRAVGSLLSHCPGREERFLAPVFAYYRRPEDLDDYTAFQLLDTAAALPDTAKSEAKRS